jgi:hypothetical protein
MVGKRKYEEDFIVACASKRRAPRCAVYLYAGGESNDLTRVAKARQSDESGFWGLVDAVLCMRLASIAAAVNV